MRQYFDKITRDVHHIYEIAAEARKLGKDPTLEVECPPAHDMAGRVENLVGPNGVADRIRQLKREKKDQDEISFIICDEIIEDKFGKFSDDEKVDRAIRVALAIKTEGVVSAPLEGISSIRIKKDVLGGPPYLALYFAGPIRAAGGTVQAFAVLIADYVARKMKIAPFEITPQEVDRFYEEVKLYDRIVNLQYNATKEEIMHAIKNIKIELNGEPTESKEVSANRNLPRIETNFVRSGPCLVLNDGVLLKSGKILKIIDKMKIPGWDWLKDIKKLSHTEDTAQKKDEKTDDKKEVDYGSGQYDGKAKIDENAKTSPTPNQINFLTPVELRRKRFDELIAPVFKYISDVIGGRPVFAYPSKIGGHRIRYGRSRNTGLAGCGFNPNTMYIMNDFLAVGTQIRIERPGKSAAVAPVSSIEGPVCLMENGDVIQFNEPNSYRSICEKNPVKKILWVGDILFGFGEFNENNHKLVPSGYVEEWWVLDLEEALKKKGVDLRNPVQGVINLKDCNFEDIISWWKNPFDLYPSGKQALELSRFFKIPLHPKYTFHYGNANGIDLLNFRSEIKDFYRKNNWNFTDFKKLRIPKTDNCINFLQNIFCPYKNQSDYIELDENISVVFIEIYALEANFEKALNLEQKAQSMVALDIFKDITEIQIKDKAPYYMGTRMGRPEKAKERKMSPPVNVLIPLGHESSSTRVVQDSFNGLKSEVDVVIRQCSSCKKVTHENYCSACNKHTDIKKYCQTCKILVDLEEAICPTCGKNVVSSSKRPINVAEGFNNFLNKIKTHQIPNIKGVKGLSSEFKMPEPIEKGVLRAKNDVWVFKDGTIRFDAIDVPFTHFTPKEIGTPILKLKELGYDVDNDGKPLESEDQVCELRVQDILITEHCGDYFLKVANFVDDELEYIYGMQRFYNIKKREDLVGHYFAGLAPHTSAAIIGRIIGFTPTSVGYAHPFWHAAKRRNCDGDEDGIMLLLDMLLNFSRYYLPAKIGGKMDAPLVLSVTLDPNEVDGEAFNVDTLPRYELEFYNKTWEYANPGDIEKKMGIVKLRLKTEAQYEGIKFTHPTKSINAGPKISSYKTMGTMDEKIDSQLDLAVKIKAVDAADVANKILSSHFTPDILGNLRSFTTQTVRCPACGSKYRRAPLSKKCNKCGGNLVYNVTKGGIVKYLDKSLKICKQFDLGHYNIQRMELIEEYVKSLTDNPKIKQSKITSFFK